MKKLLIILIAFLGYNSSAQTNTFSFSKDHDALVVEDVSRSAKFYSEVLGLEEIDNGGLADSIRWFQLKDSVQIHLIESEEIPVTHKGVHMSLNTSELDKFMKFLKDQNIDFENWPGESTNTNTRPDGVKQIYLQDPDGYWIEINDNQF